MPRAARVGADPVLAITTQASRREATTDRGIRIEATLLGGNSLCKSHAKGGDLPELHMFDRPTTSHGGCS